eukprot:3355751-Rhodomonas_salina.5
MDSEAEASKQKIRTAGNPTIKVAAKSPRDIEVRGVLLRYPNNVTPLFSTVFVFLLLLITREDNGTEESAIFLVASHSSILSCYKSSVN